MPPPLDETETKGDVAPLGPQSVGMSPWRPNAKPKDLKFVSVWVLALFPERSCRCGNSIYIRIFLCWPEEPINLKLIPGQFTPKGPIEKSHGKMNRTKLWQHCKSYLWNAVRWRCESIALLCWRKVHGSRVNIFTNTCVFSFHTVVGASHIGSRY